MSDDRLKDERLRKMAELLAKPLTESLTKLGEEARQIQIEYSKDEDGQVRLRKRKRTKPVKLPKSFIKDGRRYELHPTKGWRSRKI